MLFLQNINLFNHGSRTKKTDRQTGLLWQYRAMYYSAQHGKKWLN